MSGPSLMKAFVIQRKLFRLEEIVQISSDLSPLFTESAAQLWLGDFNALTQEHVLLCLGFHFQHLAVLIASGVTPKKRYYWLTVA